MVKVRRPATDRLLVALVMVKGSLMATLAAILKTINMRGADVAGGRLISKNKLLVR